VLWDGWWYATTAGVESELSSLRGDWPSSAAAIVALVHGLRGDVPRFEEWRSRARRIAHVDDAADSRALAAAAAFTDARVAAHTGRYGDAPGLAAAALTSFPEKWWLAYAHAAGAELAVVAGLPDAAERLAAAESAAAENDWASACLARATARHTGDPRLMVEAVPPRPSRHWPRACSTRSRCTWCRCCSVAVSGCSTCSVPTRSNWSATVSSRPAAV
jgi:hypothetical protein